MAPAEFEDEISTELQRAEGSDDATRLRVLEATAEGLEAEIERVLEMARPADDPGAARPA